MNFYLTGSINVASVDDAFELVGRHLQPGVTRVPDGEPGERANWVLTQSEHFLNNPSLEVVDGRARTRAHTPIRFDRLGYASAAIDSYRAFRRARDAGVLSADSRFLVSIPTPFNAVNSFVELPFQVEVARAYEQRLRESVDEIQAAIPPEDLAIQWDLPTELATIEGWFENPYDDVEGIVAATARLAQWVHEEVELTFHLCYGDSKFGASPFMGEPADEEAAARGGRHILPRDATAIVTLANGLSRNVSRRIDAVHTATVATWTRRAHWQPLSALALEPHTEVYLGLLHAADGADGARARAAVAAEFLPHFGLSTECGLGRHSADQLDSVLAAVSDLAQSPPPSTVPPSSLVPG